MGPRRLVWLLLLGVGCGGESARPAAAIQARPRPVAAASASAEPVDPTEPVLLPPATVRPAAWLEVEVAQTSADPIGERTVIAEGMHHALVRTGAGIFVVGERRGVWGPLVLPPVVEKMAWAGLGTDDDAVYVASDRGVLVRARNPRDAQTAAGFSTLTTLAGARSWDASRNTIAVALADSVAVSTDGGTTFHTKALGNGLAPERVLARYDGIVLATARPTIDRRAVATRTFVSVDGGERWALSSFQPLDIVRQGAWIWNNEEDCPATLSVDPRRWTGQTDLSRPNRTGWGRALRTSRKLAPSPPQRLPTAADPKPPEARAPLKLGIERPCHPPTEEFGMIGVLGGVEGGVVGSAVGSIDSFGGGGIGIGSIGGVVGTARPSRSAAPAPAASAPETPPCAGARCLAGTIGAEPAPTSTELLFFQDDAPTLALVDRAHGRVRAREAPGGCSPRQVMSLRGLVLPICAAVGGQTPIFVTDVTGEWRVEGALPVALEAARASMASDGTLLLSPERAGSAPDDRTARRAFVRAPVSLGESSAWREVSVPDAIAYRPLAGGGVLAITSTDAAGKTMSVLLERPGEPRRELARDVPVDTDLRDVTADQGRVVFLARDPQSRVSYVELYLARASLLPHTGRRVFP